MHRRDPRSHTFHFAAGTCPLGYEPHRVETRDGFALTVYRSHPLRPRSLEAPPTEPPVLLIPGFGSNRFTFGVHRHDGLVHVLNTAGREVWLAELRGARSSSFLGRGKPTLDVDAKLELDLPAVITYVLAATGASRVDLIGHSLGGLLALLTAGGPDKGHIGRVATLASPGTFKGLGGALEATGPLFGAISRGVERFAQQLDRLPVTPWARTRGPLPHLASMSRHFLPGACDAGTRRLYLDHAVEDIPGPELAQLVRWVRSQRIESRDGRSHEWRLAEVEASVLVVAATRDKVVTQEAALAAYSKVQSPDKRLMVIGREHGATRDYAHADLLLAPTAKRDVLEPVVDWLDGRRADRTRGLARGVGADAHVQVRRTPAARGSAR